MRTTDAKQANVYADQLRAEGKVVRVVTSNTDAMRLVKDAPELEVLVDEPNLKESA